jgi:NitT/TauT family transport system substrate-binding protein
MKKLMLPSLAAGSVALLALSGCGAPGADQTAEADETGLTTVAVGLALVGNNAPIFLGDAKGFFEDEGLELDLQPVTGGAAVVPSVISGSWQFGNSNLVSVMVARDKGLDVRLVAAGGSANPSGEMDGSAVIVSADSPIKRPADLVGKKVSVNTLANVGDTTVRYAVEQDGGDQSSIDFVEVAFPDAEAALNNKQVDAAWTTEPFLTQAVNNGARLISNTYIAVDPNLTITGYFATGQLIQDQPELVEKFQKAMNKSLEYAQANPAEVREIIGTYTNIDPALREQMVLSNFAVEFNREGVRKLGEAAFRYGTLSEEPNLDELLP